MSIGQRIRHAWNAFVGRDQQILQTQDLGPSYTARQDRIVFRRGVEHSIIASIYTRIAIDVASVKIQHAKLDENGRFIETINSGLNYCLNTEANIDQTSRDFIQNLVESMCDEGVVAIIPVDTTTNPRISGSYDVKTMRVAQITQWYPEHVKVRLYNPKTGRKEELILPKSMVAVIQNPLYNVMNEPNSTLRRLIHKLNLLDAVDEMASSGKLDLIIHLPYMTKTEMQKQQAENRRKNLERQLAQNKYGVAYMDATEKVTQLNRPIDNKLMEQIEYLTSMLYSQLGMTKEVFEGTADEKTMLNYFSRTIEPIVSAIADEFNRKFLTKTARSQNQKIVFFRDLFKLAPVSSIVSIGKEFTSSAIMSPNEVRQMIGLKPSDSPESDELRNRNVDSNTPKSTESPPEEAPTEDEESSFR
jgi:HK97 family phage portal protein